MTIDMTSAVVASVAFEASYLLDKASFVGDSKGFVGASYNPINSKRVSYDEVVEHPTKWYNSETDEF